MWKGTDSHGIVGSDGEVNFGKLEKQITTAIEADKRYWTENDAKIRAVSNKVGSYEEFVDIVKASHLKPLEKGDRLSDMKKFTQPWNSVVSGVNSEVSNPHEANLSKSYDGDNNRSISASDISNVNQFRRAWYKKCHSASERLDLLLGMSHDEVVRVFRTEIPGDMLGDIIQSIEEEYSESRASHIVDLLTTLSELPRFTLSLQFLSQKEANCIKSVFGKLKDSLGNVERLEEAYAN